MEEKHGDDTQTADGPKRVRMIDYNLDLKTTT